MDTITGNLVINRTKVHRMDSLFVAEARRRQLERIGGTGTELTTINGFDALESIGRYLELYNNDELGTIDGFDELESIGEAPSVRDNDVLTALPAFPALRSIGSGLESTENLIVIASNPMLSLCCGVFPFLQTTLPDGYTRGSTVFTISVNAPGCDSEADIKVPGRCLLDGVIIGDITLDSLEAITPNIRAATRIEGNLTIGDGTAGTDLTNAHIADFPVDTITGNLTINGTKIAELDAFAALRHVGGNFAIGAIGTGGGNANMTSVAGFGALESVGGGFNVIINARLTSFSAFEQLSSIGGDVYLLDNVALPSYPAFERLRSIGGALNVQGSNALTSLPAFPALRSIGSGLAPTHPPISIVNNTMLSSCCVLRPFLQDPRAAGYTLGGGKAVISSNAEGCNSPSNVNSTGACHALRISETTSGVILDEEDGTISAQLSSHIGTVSLTIDTEGGASGWTATEDPDEALITAITASGSDEEALVLTLSSNTTASPRRATVTLTTTGTGTPISKTLSLTQAPMGIILGNLVLDSLEAITDAIRSATRIEGSLSIGDGSVGDDITNAELARLQVEQITGTLRIQNTELSELDAFSSLDSIGGNLRVASNAELTRIDAFSSLRFVGGSLLIGGRDIGNAMLESISGLNALEHVGRDLIVEYNSALTTATGFERLDSIGRRLLIGNNDALTSLPDFRRLRIVRGRLGISRSNALTALPAFPALRSIGSGAESSHAPIFITFNPSLATCCGVFPFVQSPLPDGFTLGGNGLHSILVNAEGCNSLAQVRSDTRCLIEVSTPELRGLPAEAGTIEVALTFGHGTTGFEAEASDFITVPASGSASFTASYAQNAAFAPREGTITIRPTGSAFEVPPIQLSVVQRGTARTIIGNVQLDSLEAITEEIRNAQYIMGNLSIGDGSAGDDITNTELGRLQVEKTTGNLTIQGTKLTTLTAFSSLDSIGGDLGVQSNAELTSMDAFSALRTIEGGLSIGGTRSSDGNAMLGSVSGFDALDSIGGIGGISIQNNASLATITAFRRLLYLAGQLYIGGNESLTSLPDFPALRHIAASPSFPNAPPIFIVRNGNLATCCGVFPFLQTPLPPGFTMGGPHISISFARNAEGCASRDEVRASTCYLTVATTPSLLGLPQEGGTITVDLSFIGATTGTTASGASDGFLSVPDPGSNTQFTVSYGANSAATPRTDTLTITPVGSVYAPPQKFVVAQLGTDTEVQVGDLVLDSAEAITSLIQGRKHIIGDLRIGDHPSEGTDITNTELASLSLETITGDLAISGTKLTSLDAFGALTRIGGGLKIGGQGASNNELETISGFGALEHVSDSLYVIENDELETITGFGMLSSVGEDFLVEDNDLLRSVPEFGSLSSIGADFRIQDNDSLRAVAGLGNLATIGGELRIEGNESLRAIPTFAMLTSLGGGLRIKDNAGLRSVSGFGSLPTIGGDLLFLSNAELSSIPDFEALRSIEGNLKIGDTRQGNRRLTSVSGFGSLATIGGDLFFANNAVLSSIPEFTALRSVEGNLKIGTRPQQGNPRLRTISGFNALRSIGEELVIWSNSIHEVVPAFGLESVSGFNSLDTIGENLTIYANDALRTISGFDALRKVSGTIAMEANNQLSSVPTFSLLTDAGAIRILGGQSALETLLGFERLETIRGNLDIHDLSSLTDVTDFPSLTTIEGRFSIHTNQLSSLPTFPLLTSIGGNLNIGNSGQGNARLETLSGFEVLRSVGRQFMIHSNGALVSLPRFPALRSIGSASSSAPIRIESNPMLSTCCVFFPFLQDTPPTGYTLGGGEPSISDNGADCASAAAITAAGGCHGLAARAATAGLRLSEGDTIEVLLSSHIGTASLIINTEGGASGWTATRDPDGALITAVTASGSSGEALELTLSANTTASLRRDTVTLSTTGTGTPISKTLSLTQAAQGTIAGDVVLDSLEAITEAIRSATRIEGSLLIGDGEAGRDITNPELARLQVETITGALTISGTRLATLDAFSELTTIGDSLVIRENALLDSLLGFAALNSIGAALASDETPLLIEDNGTLSLCCGVSPFVQASLSSSYTLGGNARPRIEGNATGCASAEEAREACTHTISISTTTSEVEVGTESGGTIPISLPSDGTEAVLMVSLSGAATSFTAEETSDDDNFVTFSVSGELLTISYSANPGTTPRTATLRLTTTGPGASITRTLSLTQRAAGAPTLSLTTSPSELTSLAADGGTIEVSISVGGSASGWMATTDADFVTFSAASGVGSGSLTLTYAANETSEARSGMVTISTIGGTPVTETLTLTQVGATSHTVSLSTTTDGVVLGTESVGTIPISLPAAGTEAVFAINIGAGATGWTAMEASDDDNFVSAVTEMGGWTKKA